jgi:hypothetical protein
VQANSLRQRRISAEGSGDQGDLLKAVRWEDLCQGLMHRHGTCACACLHRCSTCNSRSFVQQAICCAFAESMCAYMLPPSPISCRPGHSSPGSSQSGQRHSSAGGSSPPTNAALTFSSDGGARGSSRFGPASPLARALSGMAVSIQRGISGAGDAVVRTLSGAGLMPLSHHGSASYEKIVDESADAEMALPVSHHAGHHAGRSRLGADQPQLHVQPSGLQPSKFFLPGVSAVPADSAQFAHPSSLTAAQRLQAGPAAGVGRPAPGAASIQGLDTLDEPGGLPRPPGLARIKTRPRDGSGLGAQQAAAGGERLGVGPGAALQGLQVAGGAGPAEGGSSTRWRTRLDYQADLEATSSPISAPGRAQQARDRRTPSEPGQQGTQRVRGNAGLNFVPTPTAVDATNR